MYVNLKLYGYVGCVEWIANAHGAQQERISMSASDRQAALDYYEFPVPGKISVNASKPLVTQRDLGLAYTPGVAAACEEIAAAPFTSSEERRGGQEVVSTCRSLWSPSH